MPLIDELTSKIKQSWLGKLWRRAVKAIRSFFGIHTQKEAPAQPPVPVQPPEPAQPSVSELAKSWEPAPAQPEVPPVLKTERIAKIKVKILYDKKTGEHTIQECDPTDSLQVIFDKYRQYYEKYLGKSEVPPGILKFYSNDTQGGPPGATFDLYRPLAEYHLKPGMSVTFEYETYPEEVDLIKRSNAEVEALKKQAVSPEICLPTLETLIRIAKATQRSQPTVKALVENLLIARSHAALERFKTQGQEDSCFNDLKDLVKQAKDYKMSQPTVIALIDNCLSAAALTKITVDIVNKKLNTKRRLFCNPTDTAKDIFKQSQELEGRLAFYKNDKELSGIVLNPNRPLAEYHLEPGMSVVFEYEPHLPSDPTLSITNTKTGTQTEIVCHRTDTVPSILNLYHQWNNEPSNDTGELVWSGKALPKEQDKTLEALGVYSSAPESLKIIYRPPS